MTIIFLAALGITIYFLYSTIKEYLQYEVTTVVRKINEDEMVFPIVTNCNINKVTFQEGYNYLETFFDDLNITLNDYLDYINTNRIIHNYNDLMEKFFFFSISLYHIHIIIRYQ